MDRESENTACSIPKITKDTGVMAPGYPDGRNVFQSFEGFQKSIDRADWESTTQLDLPFTDSVKSIDKPVSGLSYMQASFFATALEDFLKSIRIIGEGQSKIRRMKANSETDKLIAKKYGVADSSLPSDELAGITKENIHCENFKLSKLIKDRDYMEEVIMATYKELSVDRSYYQLVKANTDFEIQMQRFPTITEEAAKNKALSRKLRRQLRVQQNINATNMDSYCTTVHRLQVKIEEANVISTIKSQFLERWQASRVEQHKELIRRKEMIIAENIVKYKKRQEEEARVHGELDLLVGILIDDMLQEIEDLMIKYEKDTETIDMKIQKIRLKYEEMEKKRVRMEQRMAKKQKELLTWISFKEDRIRRIDYEKKMHHSASVIQAWWRGMLVRHEMGPFRRSKWRKTKNSTTI